MALKNSSLTLFKKIPRWLQLTSQIGISSISCANSVQITPQKTNLNPPHSSDFESKIEFLKRNNLHPHSLALVLDSTADVESSVKLFRWASLQKRFKHSAETYYKLILKLGMAGNLEETEAFCTEMVKEKFLGAEEGLGLIDCFVKNRRIDEALRVLFVMNTNHLKLCVRVFNSLMHVLVEEKRDLKDVVFVYKEMVKARIVPNVDTLNYLIEALFEAGRIDTAFDQYRRMNKKKCTPNSKTFEIVIKGLVDGNSIQEAIAVFSEMVELAVEHDLRFYTSVIPLFFHVNEFKIGMRLYEMMKNSNISADSHTYKTMIKRLCENLLVDDAIELFGDMARSGLTPGDDVFVDIVNGLCELNKFDEARNFVETRDAGTCSHSVLLEAYCKAGSVLPANDLFDDMFHRNITDTFSWNIMIKSLCERAELQKAWKFLCRMIICSFLPDSVTYSAIIVGQCRSGKFDDALALFRQVRSKCWVLESVSYAELVESLCQMGKIQGAEEVFCYMSSKKCSLWPTPFTALVNGICGMGELNCGVKMLALAQYSGTICSNATFNAFMQALSKSGKAKDLFVMLSRMIVGGCAPDKETYCIVIQSMCSVGRLDDSRFFFSLMLREDLQPTSETLNTLFSCLAKRSQLHMFLSEIDKLVIESDILDPAMYNILIIGLWKEGIRSKAHQLLDLMLEKGWVPDAVTHGLLMGSSAEEETHVQKFSGESSVIQDEISGILTESLGET